MSGNNWSLNGRFPLLHLLFNINELATLVWKRHTVIINSTGVILTNKVREIWNSRLSLKALGSAYLSSEVCDWAWGSMMILMLFIWAQALDEVMLLRCQYWIDTCWALSSQLKTLSRWRTWLHQRWWISLLFRYCLLIKGLKLFRVDSLHSSTLVRCVDLYRFSFRTSSIRNLGNMRGWGLIPYPFNLFDWSWRRRFIYLRDLF